MEKHNEEVIPTCAQCLHFKAAGDGTVCKRNPPFPFMIMNKNPLTNEVTPSVISGFPPVAHDEICGEFFPVEDGDVYFSLIDSEEAPAVM